MEKREDNVVLDHQDAYLTPVVAKKAASPLQGKLFKKLIAINFFRLKPLIKPFNIKMNITKSLNILFLFISAFVFIHCGTNNRDEHSTSMELVKTDTIRTIYYDSLSSPLQSQIRYYSGKDGVETIYSINKLKNKLETYSWKTGKLLRRIPLEVEGPNGVGIITAMYIKSPDSLYVLASYMHRISLIDSNGKVLKKYSLLPKGTTKEALGVGMFSYGGHGNQMIESDGHLYASGSSFDDFRLLRFYTKGQCGLDLDLSTGEIKSLMPFPVKWKKMYEDKYILTSQRTEFTQTYYPEKKIAVLNIPTDNEVYEIDLKTKALKKHVANSNYFESISWFPVKKYSVEKEFDFHIKNPFYESIYFDPFRKVYLRFVAHPNKEKVDFYDGRAFSKYSCIILDENFTIKGEVMLGDEVRTDQPIITKEGIYLDKYVNSEDKSYCRLYKLKTL